MCPSVNWNRINGKINDSLPAFLSSLYKLRVVELNNTQLSGTFPASYFTNWPYLETFALNGAGVGGQLPAPWVSEIMVSIIAPSYAAFGCVNLQLLRVL